MIGSKEQLLESRPPAPRSLDSRGRLAARFEPQLASLVLSRNAYLANPVCAIAHAWSDDLARIYLIESR